MHARQRGPEQRYGSPEQCAEYLGASRAWFLEHVAPHLKTARIGTRRVFSFAEIDAWWAGAAAGGEPIADGAPSGPVRRPVGRPRRVV
jgi:predicted DNA-binding transcriptional regulator AlpA